MRLEVRDLRLVAAIADMGNLTRAGQLLHLSQSALSHQLADLERRVGGQLFERSGRRLIATRLGERLRDGARATLDHLRVLESEVADMALGREAALRVATECYTGYHWLPPVLDDYRKRYPAVDVRIVPEATSRPIRALIAGVIDLCVFYNPVKDRRVRVTRLFDDELVLVVGLAHPLASRPSVDPAELRNERFLTYREANDSTVFREILGPAGMSTAQVCPLTLTEAIVELVKANMGIGVLARWAIEPYLASGALRTVPIDHPRVRRTWQAAIRAKADPPEFLTEFVEHLARTMSAPPRRKPEFALIRSVAKLGAKSDAPRSRRSR